MKTIRRHILIIVLALVSVAVITILYIYMYRAVNGSSAKAILAQSIMNAQTLSNAERKKTGELFDRTKDDRAKLLDYFLTDDRAINFIEDLEALGKTTGATVSLSNVNAAEAKASTKTVTYGSVLAHVDVKGTWSQIMQTLILCEVLKYQSDLSSVHIALESQVVDKKQKPVWHMTFDIDTDTIGNQVSNTAVKKIQ